jgi:hypothetical protein
LVAGWPYADELRAWIEAPAPGAAPRQHTIPAQAGRVRLQFRAAETVRGRLVATDGTGVGGRTVLLQPLDEVPDNQNRVVVTSAPDGTFAAAAPVAHREKFALRVLDGGVVVDARHHASGNARVDRAWYVAAHDAATPHEIRVGPASRARLAVTGSDGTPVHGASVYLCWAHGVRPGFDLLRSYVTTIGYGTSDLDGRVEIAGLDLTDLDPLAVVAIAERGIGQVQIAPDAGPSLELGTLVLAPAATIAGICVDGDGKPQAGVRVLVHNGAWLGATCVATDRDGRFTVSGLTLGRSVVSRGIDPSGRQVVMLAAGVNELTLR